MVVLKDLNQLINIGDRIHKERLGGNMIVIKTQTGEIGEFNFVCIGGSYIEGYQLGSENMIKLGRYEEERAKEVIWMIEHHIDGRMSEVAISRAIAGVIFTMPSE